MNVPYDGVNEHQQRDPEESRNDPERDESVGHNARLQELHHLQIRAAIPFDGRMKHGNCEPPMQGGATTDISRTWKISTTT